MKRTSLIGPGVIRCKLDEWQVSSGRVPGKTSVCR
jgi:hypothetical protein